ncbi:hypothetical protein RDWZM_006801 [Blomia tropicalis]|uniref:Voltage-dependent anion-selective channel n=1 Tax=Blomia tropicalis TaxID=40697 RepID=A0A9Q0RNP6_BLOTA|nr:hypothetical protein RDWZM_006801 [Blomia tropicalis]
MEGGQYNITGELEFEAGTPRLNASGVYKYNDWLLGTQALIDAKAHKIMKQTMAFGLFQSGANIIGNYENGKEFTVGAFKTVSGSEERGMQLSWDEKGQAKLVFGVKYNIDGASSIKAKVNSGGQIGLSYIYQYRAGIKCSLSTQLEAKNLMTGGHKMGFGLQFDG